MKLELPDPNASPDAESPEPINLMPTKSRSAVLLLKPAATGAAAPVPLRTAHAASSTASSSGPPPPAANLGHPPRRACIRRLGEGDEKKTAAMALAIPSDPTAKQAPPPPSPELPYELRLSSA